MRLTNPGIQDGSVTIAKLGYINRLALVNQGADVPNTNLIASPASGLYRITSWIIITRAATTSCTLPPVFISWTDLDSGVAITDNLTLANSTNAAGIFGEQTGTVSGFPHKPFTIVSAAGVPIVVHTSGYASVGATSMQFALRIVAEGPF